MSLENILQDKTNKKSAVKGNVFEIVLSALVDIRSTNELTFGGPVLIVVDQRNMSITKMI